MILSALAPALLAFAEGIDIGTALEGLPVAAAVAVATLWVKVHRLEKDHERAEMARERQHDDTMRVMGDLKVAITKLETTLGQISDVVGRAVRVDFHVRD